MANILIVDGHRHVAELLTEELITEGYSVDSIGDPDIIGERITRFAPDLILLDLYLNRKTRWDVLRDIKLRYPRLPVLIFTAYDGYKRDPRISQADGFIIKSIYFDQLIHHLDAIFNREPIFHSARDDFNIPPTWRERRSGQDRRKTDRRRGERRSGGISLEFLLWHKVNCRSGLDRRKDERRKRARRRGERGAVWSLATHAMNGCDLN